MVSSPTTDLQRSLATLNTSATCSNPDSRNTTLSTKVSELSGLSQANWINLGNNRYYRLREYDYRPTTSGPILGQGVLILEGRSRKAALTSTSSSPNSFASLTAVDNAESFSRLVVTIPVYPSYPVAFSRETVPALWISQGATEDRSQTSGITASSPRYTNGSDFQGDVVMSDTTAATGFVESTNTLRPNLECHINANNIEQPDTAVSPGYKSQFLDVAFPSLPDLPTVVSRIPDYQQNLDLNTSQTFPRTTGTTPDRATSISINGQSQQIYEYVVNSITLSGNDTITITPGQRVVFYVQGSISGSGNGGIKHTCASAPSGSTCKPTDVQIFGYNSSGSASPAICIKGHENLEAFIFAPAYALGKTGNGSFKGAIWGKSWGKISNCGSNNGDTSVIQGARWDDLIQNLKPAPLASVPQIGQVMTYCEEPLDATTASSQCIPNLPTLTTTAPSPSPGTGGSPGTSPAVSPPVTTTVTTTTDNRDNYHSNDRSNY